EGVSLLTGLQVELEAYAAGAATPSASYRADASLGPAQTLDLETRFDTSGWPDGEVVLQLAAVTEAGVRLPLDQLLVQLLDDSVLLLNLHTPVDGVTVNTATVEFSGLTAAGATVEIQRGAESWSVEADVAGAFAHAAVPLQPGINR